MAKTNRLTTRPAPDSHIEILVNQIPKSSLDILARSLLNFCEHNPEIVAEANKRIEERRRLDEQIQPNCRKMRAV